MNIRKTREELEQLKKDLNIDKLWSFSSISTYLTSPYEYFLKYIKHEKPDADANIYGVMGGLVHDTIEAFYNNEIKYDEMFSRFDNFWNINIDLLKIKFDRNNEEMNTKIKSKYYECLKEFMLNHEVINDKMLTEQFMTIKVGDYYFQGYADSITQNKDGVFTVIDWKSSTIYKSKDISEKQIQLLLYSLGLYQKANGNLPLNKIKACWNFLKYVNVTVKQVNGKEKIRSIERNKIGEKLQSNAKTWLKKSKELNDKTVDDYLNQMLLENSIDCLPNDVKDKFTINDCYVYIDVNPINIQHIESLLVNTIQEIEQKTKEYELTKDESIFYDTEESVKEQEYYFFNLCDYTANKHIPFKRHLEILERNKSGDEFGQLPTTQSFGVLSKQENEDNNSWMDSLFG